VGRDPDPTRLDGRPEAGPPDVTVVLPVPTARRPEDVRRGRRAVRSRLQARWRRRQVSRLSSRGGLILRSTCGLAHRNPGSRDPLEAALDLVPVAGHPLAAWRRLTPDPADPEVIVAGLVPAPVSGDPLDVLAGRLLVRRHLFDWRRRLFADDQSRRRIMSYRRGEGLVYRPARQDLHIRILIRNRTRALIWSRNRTCARILGGCHPYNQAQCSANDEPGQDRSPPRLVMRTTTIATIPGQANVHPCTPCRGSATRAAR